MSVQRTCEKLIPIMLDSNTCILRTLCGSKTYGTDTEDSDLDYMSVYVAPKSHYTGVIKTPDSFVKKTDEYEETGFELHKFLKLCMQFNPNAIPALYVDPKFYTLTSCAYNMLRSERDIFISQRAQHTFLGYAESQRKNVVNGDTGKLGQKRKELVAKYGYDTKFAMHTIRILETAKEFFRDGILTVYRENDRELLLDYRNGKYSLDQWIKHIDQQMIDVKKEITKTLLPKEPNVKRINEIAMSIVESYSKDQI